MCVCVYLLVSLSYHKSRICLFFLHKNRNSDNGFAPLPLSVLAVEYLQHLCACVSYRYIERERDRKRSMHLQIDAEMRPINMVCCTRSVNTQSRRRRISIYTYICICSCIYLFVYVSVTVSVTLLQSRCLLRHIFRHLAGEDSTLKWKSGKFCSFQRLLDRSSCILYIFKCLRYA